MRKLGFKLRETSLVRALVPSLVALGLLVGFARREPEAAAALRQRKRSRSSGLSAGRVPGRGL